MPLRLSADLGIGLGLDQSVDVAYVLHCSFPSVGLRFPTGYSTGRSGSSLGWSGQSRNLRKGRCLGRCPCASGFEARRAAVTASRRIGEPQDIADPALFLASDRSAYLNGAELVVDGGLSCMLMDSVPRPGFNDTPPRH